ncbi:hypothetical protein NEFER01_1863, partial [Nematocida sp. LUAm1]
NTSSAFAQPNASSFGQSAFAQSPLGAKPMDTSRSGMFNGWSNRDAFGNTQSTVLSNTTGNSTLNPSLNASTGNSEDILCTIEYLEKSYDRNSPFYKFVYTFYDMVDKSKPRPNRPINVSQELWEQAEKQNPYPQDLSPSILLGYDDLYVRLERQKVVIDKLVQSRTYLANRVNDLAETGVLRLSQRISSIVSKYNGLLVEILEQLDKALGKDAENAHFLYSQMNKRVTALSDGINSFTESISMYKRVFEEEKASQVFEILKEQRRILLNTIKTIKIHLEKA